MLITEDQSTGASHRLADRPPGGCTAHHPIHTVEHDGRMAVHVFGAADLHTSTSLRRALGQLSDAGYTDFVVDLTAVSFIDSTGLGVLVGAVKTLRDSGGHLVLVVDQPQVLRMLRITGLTEVFAIHPTVDSALAA